MQGIHARSLLRDQRGLSTVEYTVLLVLIVACTVGIWGELGGKVKKGLQDSSDKLDPLTNVNGT